MADLDALQAFDLADCNSVLWSFKKRTSGGQPVFTGRWVATTLALDNALTDALRSELERIEEVLEYGLLAQNNEQSALTINVDETHADAVIHQAAAETPNKQITDTKHLNNAAFYVAKFSNGDQVVYGVKKPDRSWRTSANAGLARMVFREQELDLSNSPSFNLATTFDFIIFDGCIYIGSKQNFESALSYKAAHEADFASLCNDQDFADVFSELATIVDFVGNNKIQLRRASAIRQKAHFRDAVFMQNLRNQCVQLGFDISFDDDGKIDPQNSNCRDIFTALLDHRLTSTVSTTIYDVQNAEAIQP